MDFEVTDEDIALGCAHSAVANPIAKAVSRRLGRPAAVRKGPSISMIADEAMQPESYVRNTTWFAVIDGEDVPLPRRVQIWLNVFQHGPGGGALYAIRDRAGRVVAMRPYCEIIRPFTFRLEEKGV